MSRFSSPIHSAGPRLERMLLLASSGRVVDANLRWVDVEHSPRDGSVEHLPERLRRFEAVAVRQRHPPLGDLLRGQLGNAAAAEDGGCLAEQIAELLDRNRLDVVLCQVRLHEFRERERARDPTLAAHPLKLALERIERVLLGSEAAALNALRVATASPVAVRPQPLAAGTATG
jgi:hypothetical protein